jgi:predicted nicotinamide N-methyase
LLKTEMPPQYGRQSTAVPAKSPPEAAQRMSDSILAQRRDRLAQRYELVSEILSIGNFRLEIVRPADADALLDEQQLLEPHDEMPWHPYWAHSWDAAYGMAWELAERKLSGLRVLDLGCGLGITGAAAAAAGAFVLLADHAPPALEFAELNCWTWRDRVATRTLDWRTDQLGEQFDLIVGSDILYDRSDLAHLVSFWRGHLAPGGQVLLADPCRPLTAQLFETFPTRGWLRKEHRRRVPQTNRPIRIVELDLRASSESRETL